MVIDDRPEFESALLRAGLDYWRSLDQADGVPRDTAFDPMAISKLLPHAVWMEVAGPPLDFRYRLIGEATLTYFGGDYSGKWLSEIPHKAAPSALFDTLSRAVESRRPYTSNTPYVGPKQDIVHNNELLLPFADATGRISRLLILLDFTPRRA